MFGKTPLLWLVIPYLSGIIISSLLPVAYVAYSIPLLTLLTVGIAIQQFTLSTAKNRFLKFLLILMLPMLMLGIYNYQQRYQKLTTLAREQLPNINTAVFKILTPPAAYIQKKYHGKWRTQAQLLEINGNSLKEPFKVNLSGKGDTNLQYGDILRTKTILLLIPDKPYYKDGFSPETYLFSQDIAANAIITGRYLNTPSQQISIRRSLQAIRTKAIQNTLHYCPDNTGAFIAATIFGYRQALGADIETSFRNTGIGHILAISGLHIGLIILIINVICKRLHLTPRQRAGVIISVCLLFLFLSGARSSVVRASIIAFIYLTGIIIFRKSNFINSLAAAALLICLVNPFQIFDVGFQLSFISVIFISILTRRFNTLTQPLFSNKHPGKKSKRSYLSRLTPEVAMLLVVSTSAWVGTLPLSAYYFNSVSIIGFITNLLIIPIMPFAIAGGLLLQLTPLLPVNAAGYFATLCSLPTELIIAINDKLTGLPVTATTLFPPATGLILLYYILFAIVFIITAYKDIPSKIYLALAAIGIMLVAAVFINGKASCQTSQTSITLLRSRNGESAVIRYPAESKAKPTAQTNNTSLLIQESESPARIITYLYSEHIKNIDTVYYVQKNQELPPQYTKRLNIRNLEIIKWKQKQQSVITYEPVPGIIISVTRSDTGQIKWCDINANNIDLLLTSWQKPELYQRFCTEKRTGYDAAIKILRITGNNQLSETAKNTAFILRDKNIAKNKGRNNYGIINITRKDIQLWDQERFITNPYPAMK